MRFRLLLSLAALHFCASQCYAQIELISNRPGWAAHARGLYVFHSGVSDDPAFGVLTGPTVDRSAGNAPPTVNGVNVIQGTSHDLDAKQATIDGPGLRLSVLNQNRGGWFGGAIYEGILIHGYRQIGGATDIDNIHANFINRTLADNNALNDDFDSGLVDFASDHIDLNKQSLEILFGRKVPVTTRVTAFWKIGLRGTYTDMKRNVFYRNIETLVLPGPIFIPNADVDTANINFQSEMWGIGPVFGAGAIWGIGDYWTLSGEASLGGSYTYFDLKRNESNFNQTLQRHAFSNIKTDSTGFVPTMEMSFELTGRILDNCHVAIGYTASASLGGARRISIPGWDDVDDETPAYIVENDDIITHGVYISACLLTGR